MRSAQSRLDPVGGTVASHGLRKPSRHWARPESKAQGPDGLPGHAGTRGLMSRRSVQPSEVVRIGKEGNQVKEVEIGLVREWEEIQEVYRP